MALRLRTATIEGLHGDGQPAWPAVYSLSIASSFLFFSAIEAWQLRGTCVKVKPGSSSVVKLVCSHSW